MLNVSHNYHDDPALTNLWRCFECHSRNYRCGCFHLRILPASLARPQPTNQPTNQPTMLLANLTCKSRTSWYLRSVHRTPRSAGTRRRPRTGPWSGGMTCKGHHPHGTLSSTPRSNPAYKRNTLTSAGRGCMNLSRTPCTLQCLRM